MAVPWPWQGSSATPAWNSSSVPLTEGSHHQPHPPPSSLKAGTFWNNSSVRQLSYSDCFCSSCQGTPCTVPATKWDRPCFQSKVPKCKDICGSKEHLSHCQVLIPARPGCFEWGCRVPWVCSAIQNHPEMCGAGWARPGCLGHTRDTEVMFCTGAVPLRARNGH